MSSVDLLSLTGFGRSIAAGTTLDPTFGCSFDTERLSRRMAG